MLDSNQPAQIQRLDETLNFLHEASLDILLFNKRITKALPKLCRCKGWSASLMFASNTSGFLESMPNIKLYAFKIIDINT